ncbi:MAG: spore coat U domain-containing protein [Gammaproteobacteria bacterium]|jgi:spore coat protein U-like protein
MTGARTWAQLALGILAWLAVVPAAEAINCRVQIAAMNFGTYMPLQAAPLDVNGGVTIRCQAQAGSFTVTLGAGLSGEASNRTMISPGGGVLNYNLYADPARTLVWGDGTGATATVSGVREVKGRPVFFDYAVYGRVFPDQAPPPGSYTDTILVTVLF